MLKNNKITAEKYFFILNLYMCSYYHLQHTLGLRVEQNGNFL